MQAIVQSAASVVQSTALQPPPTQAMSQSSAWQTTLRQAPSRHSMRQLVVSGPQPMSGAQESPPFVPSQLMRQGAPGGHCGSQLAPAKHSNQQSGASSLQAIAVEQESSPSHR